MALKGTDVTVVNTTATNLGASTVTGNFSLTSTGGNVTDSGTVSVTGTTTIDAAGKTITLDDGSNSFTGAMALKGTDVTVVNTTATNLGASTVTGELQPDQHGRQRDRQRHGVGDGTTTIDAAGKTITLDDGSNSFTGAMALKGTDVTVVNTTATNLGASTVTGNFSLTSTGGNVTDSGTVSVTGTTTIDAAGKTITLDDGSNSFTGAMALKGTDVTVVNTTATNLGASTVTGNFSLTSTGGNVTDSGTVSVTGTTTIDAAGKTITLDDGSNSFTGAMALKGTDVTVVNTTATNLGASTVTGNFSLTSTGGNVTDSGTVSVTGTTTINAAGKNITLDEAASTYTGAMALKAVDAAVTNNTDTNIGASTITGNLTLNSANGNVTDSGTVSVTGTTTINAAGKNITLDEAASTYTGAMALKAVDASVFNNTATKLGASTITGNLTLNSNGDVTQTAGISVSGSTTITAGANDVTLDTATNDFVGSINIVSADAVTLDDANTLPLGTITATSLAFGTANTAYSLNGNITLTNNPLTFDAAVTMLGNSVLATGSGNVSFQKTVDGGFALTVNSSGTTDFDMAIGGGTALSALTVDANGTANFDGTIKTTGNITVDGTTINLGGDVTTTAGGKVVFTSPITLGAGVTRTIDTSAQAGADVTVNGVTGAADATLNINSAGLTTLFGTFDNAYVKTDSAGTAKINGTAGAATFDIGENLALCGTLGGGGYIFGGNVELCGDTTFNSNNVAFGGKVDSDVLGPWSLELNVSTLTSFGGNVGTIKALSTLTTDAAGSTTLTGSVNTIVSGSGGITFGDDVTAGAASLTLSSGTGNITANDAGNNFASLNLSGGAVIVRDVDALTVSSLTSGANKTVTLVAGTTLTLPASAINTGTADLELRSQNGTLTTAADLTGNNIILQGQTGLSLGHIVTSTTNTTLQAAGGAINQTGGKLAVTGTLTSTSDTGTTLNSLTNSVGTFTGTNTTSGNVELTVSNALLNVTAITNTGDNVTLVADDLNITGAISAAGSLVTLAPFTNNRAVNIAGGAGGLNLTAAEVNLVSAADLAIGGTAASSVTVNGAMSVTGAPNVTLTSGNSSQIALNGNLTVTNQLTLNSAGAINQTTGTKVTATSLDANANNGITMNSTAGNAVATVDLYNQSAGNISYRSAVAGGSTITADNSQAVTGSVSLTELSGNLTLPSVLSAGGPITITGASTKNVAITTVDATQNAQAAGADIVIKADGLSIGTTVDAGTGGLVTITTATVSRAIDLGDKSATSPKLGLTAASLALINAGGGLQFGDKTHTGAIEVSDAVTISNNVTLQNKSGTIDVGAVGTGTGHLTVNGNLSILAYDSSNPVNTGKIINTAAGTLTVNGNLFMNATSGIGQISLLRPIIIDSVTGDLTAINTTTGDLYLRTNEITLGGAGAVISQAAGQKIRIDADLSASQDIIIADVVSAGSVELNATGAIISTAPMGSPVTASTARFTANEGIGTFANPIQTDVTTVTADNGATAGDIYITNVNNLTVGTTGVSNKFAGGVIDLHAGGTMTVSGTISSNNGDATLTTDSGTVLVNANIAAGTGDFVGDAGSGDFNINANITGCKSGYSR
ncbi:MAG: S-layer family protein [Ramlibacter sp.]|nr:S-layer family protein [Ramlibacter sp.]